MTIRMRDALLKCREEFCWHGNTGKSLSQQSYGELVDMIDKALEDGGYEDAPKPQRSPE